MTIKLVRVETMKPEEGEKQIAALEARGFEYVSTTLNQHGAVAVVTMRRDDRTAGQVAVGLAREALAASPVVFARVVSWTMQKEAFRYDNALPLTRAQVDGISLAFESGLIPDATTDSLVQNLRIVDPADKAEKTAAEAAPAPAPFVLNTDIAARRLCFATALHATPDDCTFTAEDKHMRALVAGSFVRGTERLYTAAPPNPSPPTLAEFAKFANDYPAVLTGVAVPPTGEGDDAQSNVAIIGVSLDLDRLGGDISRMRCMNDFRALTRTATVRDDGGTVISAVWSTE